MTPLRPVLLVAAALLLCSAGAAHAAGRRSLKADGLVVTEGGFAKQPKFPYCSCKDYRSTSSPYRISLTDSNLTNAEDVGEMCFTIRYKGPATNPSDCYRRLEQSLFKIHLSMQPACPASFDVTNRYVTVNGVRKMGGVQVEDFPLGSLLKITTLRLNSTTAHNTRICIRAAYPCNIAENFFTEIPVPISVIESSGHRCCARAPR